MNSHSKIIFAITIVSIIVVALVATIYFLNSAQSKLSILPSGNPPESQLKIVGDFEAEKTLATKDLVQIPLKNVTITIKGETASYVGVSLLDLLNKTDASWGAGFINVIAADGYNKTLNTYQAYNSTQYLGSEIILAFAKNGNWIVDPNEGPLKLIAPGLASAYNVKRVIEINLQPWTINVTGLVNDPIVLNGSNFSGFETKTVQATFAPGGEPQRTSNWTGISLWSVLQAANVSPNASKVTVSAIDGYSREYTIAQVKDLDILIGYKENGAFLSPSNGQPYRLVVPVEDYKWGQYWVRWISQIIVA